MRFVIIAAAIVKFEVKVASGQKAQRMESVRKAGRLICNYIGRMQIIESSPQRRCRAIADRDIAPPAGI